MRSSESRSVMSGSLWSYGLHSPWNPPGQNTGVGSYPLLQGIFPTQGSNPRLLHRLHWQVNSLPLSHHNWIDSSPERRWREKAFQSFLPPRPDWTSYKNLFPQLLSAFFFFSLIFIGVYLFYWPWWLGGKEYACHCRRFKRLEFNPWGEKISWSRKWQPAPVFLPEK